ncbi:MAG: serine hydrolase, partial [Gammaproteobacteria bacterium]|nr:serine hydrolase [Gammaproteobacteria bacterium]
MDTKTKRNFFCKSGRLLALFFLSLIAVLTAHAQESRFVDPADDEKLLPYDGHVLTDRDDAQIVRFRNWDRFNPVREIRAGNYTLALPKVEFDWSDFSYVVDGKEYTIEDYMVKNHTGGLLVMKNGQRLLERYAMGNDEQTLWISFSMSKSVTSMLLGAAIADGYIRSADDAVSDYLPRLR